MDNSSNRGGIQGSLEENESNDEEEEGKKIVHFNSFLCKVHFLIDGIEYNWAIFDTGDFRKMMM